MDTNLASDSDTPAECSKQLPCQPGSKLPHIDLCSRYYLCGKDGKQWTLARCTSKHRYSFFNKKTERCEQSREPPKNCKVVCPDKDQPQPPTKMATTTGRRTMQSTRAPPTATYSTAASYTQPQSTSTEAQPVSTADPTNSAAGKAGGDFSLFIALLSSIAMLTFLSGTKI